MCPRIELKFMQEHPQHNITTAFSVDQLLKVLENMFGRTRFDAEESSDSDSEDSDYEADDDSTSEIPSHS